MLENYFVEIPIYHSSEDEYNKATECHINQEMARAYQPFGITEEDAPESFKRFREYLWKEHGGVWRYNGIIGFLRLYIVGMQIRGETWFVDAKRVSRQMRRKFFIHTGKTFEIHVSCDAKNHQILQQILAAIQEAQKSKPLKGRYLDLSSFQTIASHVDWRALMAGGTV